MDFIKNLELILDKNTINNATSGWMEENCKDLEFIDEYKIKFTNLKKDYDWSTTNNSITFDITSIEKEADRCLHFNIYNKSLDQNQFIKAMTIFEKEKIIPQIDIFRYNKIACEAINAKNIIEKNKPTEKTIIKDLMDDILKVRNKIGYDLELIISLNNDLSNILYFNNPILKFLESCSPINTNFDLNKKVLNNCSIIKVSSNRMFIADYINYCEEINPHSRIINWIITAKNAPITISKTYLNLNTSKEKEYKDAYIYDKYDYLWIPEDNLDSIFVNLRI